MVGSEGTARGREELAASLPLQLGPAALAQRLIFLCTSLGAAQQWQSRPQSRGQSLTDGPRDLERCAPGLVQEEHKTLLTTMLSPSPQSSVLCKSKWHQLRERSHPFQSACKLTHKAQSRAATNPCPCLSLPPVPLAVTTVSFSKQSELQRKQMLSCLDVGLQQSSLLLIAPFA